MSRQGIRSIKTRTVDTDVVVIAIALFSRLNSNKLWIEFGTGNNKVFYPVHLICNNLGSEKCKALLFFMYLLDATKCLISTWAKRKLRGKHGKATQK